RKSGVGSVAWRGNLQEPVIAGKPAPTVRAWAEQYETPVGARLRAMAVIAHLSDRSASELK
uniref:hypothetical protein n=1 Tax=Ectopseudomonas khazarica TaxID=2502979 RepID=UPI003A90465D